MDEKKLHIVLTDLRDSAKSLLDFVVKASVFTNEEDLIRIEIGSFVQDLIHLLSEENLDDLYYAVHGSRGTMSMSTQLGIVISSFVRAISDSEIVRRSADWKKYRVYLLSGAHQRLDDLVAVFDWRIR